MNKKTQYTINCAISGTLITGMINVFKQFNRMEDNPEIKFDWLELLKVSGKGALIGGGVGFVVGTIVDDLNANTMAINTDAYLKAFALVVQANKNSSLYKMSENKCVQIIKFIEKEFASELSDVPFQWGSTVKGTAIEGKSDFDIMVRFYRNSFNMGDMFRTMLNVFEEKFTDNSLVKVIDQKKSVGLILKINDEDIKIDVVPMRAINDNTKNTASNLYVNNKGLFAKPSYTKTNIPLQASIKLTPVQMNIIIMLKKWKVDYDVPMSSYMIQLFVTKAYDRNKSNIPRKLTDKLLMVLEFIAKNIQTIRLISPENTNNVVSDIPNENKIEIRRKALKIIEEYTYHPNTIQDFFIDSVA